MTLPKIKHVRAWFTGGATAEQGAGGGETKAGADQLAAMHVEAPDRGRCAHRRGLDLPSVSFAAALGL